MAGISLYPHQADAIRKMKNGCILCGGVGSGKSRTALSFYYILEGGEIGTDEYVPMGDPPRDLFIITTARKRDTCEWERELSPFLLSTDPEANLYANKVTIDSWNNIGKYRDIKGAFFIFDEQRVVGSGAWVKAFLKITKENLWVLLSATPGDTWSDYIPVLIANGYFKNRTDFTRQHVVYSRFTKYPKVERYVGEGSLRQMRSSILVPMDFVRSALPHHEHVCVPYDAGKYREICKTRWNPWKGQPIINAGEFCYALRKSVNSDSRRLEKVLEIMELHPKAIIFYNFDYELELLEGILYEAKIPGAQWNGHRHEPVPDGDMWAYLVQYAAGAEGWNCTATDAIIFYSQNYSYKVMAQAAGRIDRLNTPYSDLWYYHLESRAGIDVAIRRALKEKKKFNENGFYSKRR